MARIKSPEKRSAILQAAVREIAEVGLGAPTAKIARRAGLEELYPNGGFLGTGFRMWGINGTARVLIEYTKKVRNKGLILEPVDIKKDLYGFVYAPERYSRGLYNPFPNASAYHQCSFPYFTVGP